MCRRSFESAMDNIGDRNDGNNSNDNSNGNNNGSALNVDDESKYWTPPPAKRQRKNANSSALKLKESTPIVSLTQNENENEKEKEKEKCESEGNQEEKKKIKKKEKANKKINDKEEDDEMCNLFDDEIDLDKIDCKKRIKFDGKSWQFKLLIDEGETLRRTSNEKILNPLKYLPKLCNCYVEKTKLSIGDYLWILEERKNRKKQGDAEPIKRKIVLNLIVERKRFDDLEESIHGQRAVDQTLRINKCGIKRKIYLVENDQRALSGHSRLRQAKRAAKQLNAKSKVIEKNYYHFDVLFKLCLLFVIVNWMLVCLFFF